MEFQKLIHNPKYLSFLRPPQVVTCSYASAYHVLCDVALF